MKRMNRIISTILLAGMLLSLGGCGNNASGNGEPLADGEPVDVSMAVWNFTEPNGNEVGERIVEKVRNDFGINIQVVSVTMADYREKISTLAASDSLPDLFVADGWDNKIEFKKFVDQGLIR